MMSLLLNKTLEVRKQSQYVHDYAITFSITFSVHEFLLEVYHKNSNSDAYNSLLCWSTTCLQTLNSNTCWTGLYYSHIFVPHKLPPFSSPTNTPHSPSFTTPSDFSNTISLNYISPHLLTHHFLLPLLSYRSFLLTNLLYYLTKLLPLYHTSLPFIPHQALALCHSHSPPSFLLSYQPHLMSLTVPSSFLYYLTTHYYPLYYTSLLFFPHPSSMSLTLPTFLPLL